MPGLTDWFDVFRCGTHTDRFGREVTITRDDIDAAIDSYKKDSAPIVVGHPSLNAPAFGWIGAFRRVGDLVQAKASTVADEFADLVNRKLYKNRSLSFGPGMHFRHVGFLGAQPPAVKGLKDIQFSQEEEIVSVEFAEQTADSMQQTADTRNAAGDMPEAKPESEDKDEFVSALREIRAELDRCRQESERLRQELENVNAQKRAADFSSYTQELVNDGRLPKAYQKNICEFMECLQSKGVYEFSEGAEPIVERFKRVLKEILKPVEFAEIATPQAVKTATPTAKDLASQIRSARAELAAQGVSANVSQVMARLEGGK